MCMLSMFVKMCLFLSFKSKIKTNLLNKNDDVMSEHSCYVRVMCITNLNFLRQKFANF